MCHIQSLIEIENQQRESKNTMLLLAASQSTIYANEV